ncbi:hypothetical protein OTK49_03270 [Vibrio coralliirubri]|uniref:hypothetical protein n=1 Tax=Vibrio coralliirubri TaxID=1516159 RepID=UPI0022836986|nr:hypothetical protein [Vibrio coralliirubri]MCY9861537.1 hypothetical protein [Vibrio coralliirubri]
MNQTTLFNQRLALLKQNGEGRINSSFAIVGTFPELVPSISDVLLYAKSHDTAKTMLTELEKLTTELPQELQSEVSLSIKTVWLALEETEELSNVKLDKKWFAQFVNFLLSIQNKEPRFDINDFEGSIEAPKKFKKQWIDQGLHYHYCASYYAAAEILMSDDEKSQRDLNLEEWAAKKVVSNLHLLKDFRYL